MGSWIVNLNLVVLFSICTPLTFWPLIFTAEVSDISFTMAKKVFRFLLIPLDTSVTIASSVLVCLLWWSPSNSGIGKSSFPWSITDGHKFSFVNVIHLDVSIRASRNHVLIVIACLKWEYFSMRISKEIDQAGFATLECLDLDFSKLIFLFLLLQMLCLSEMRQLLGKLSVESLSRTFCWTVHRIYLSMLKCLNYRMN